MQRSLIDLDYFRTNDDIICYVKGYCHPDGLISAIPVFWPDSQGKRIHESGRRYCKDVKDRIIKIPVEDIVEVFKPTAAFERFLAESEDSIWRKIALAFIEAGISQEDIGIFGSYLVGLAKRDGGIIKDIDFLIYGLDNFRKLRNGGLERIRERLGLGRISQDHINWHAQKYGRYFKPGMTDFQKTLERKWPALQIAPGVLSTLRFVYKKNEIPPNPVASDPLRKITVQGKVIKDEGVHFMPRVFEISSSEGIFKAVTYFWAFYCAVKEGDLVQITGTLHKDRILITLEDSFCGIKILN